MCLKIPLIFVFCWFLSLSYCLELIPKPSGPEPNLIYYNVSDPESSLKYRQELDKFWSLYTAPPIDYSHIIICEQGIPPREGSNQFCNVDLHTYGPCTPDDGYKYNSSTHGPCVYLKFRKMPNWVPEYYNTSTIPSDMPENLKKHIIETENAHGADSTKLKVVWVSCEGEDPADIKKIGPIDFYPKFGYDGQYFPIRNEEHYIVPFIAIWFRQPQRGALIIVKCKAWARNLQDESIPLEIVVD